MPNISNQNPNDLKYHNEEMCMLGITAQPCISPARRDTLPQDQSWDEREPNLKHKACFVDYAPSFSFNLNWMVS